MTDLLHVYEHFEPAIGHALHVERHVLGAHARQALILHDLGQDLVAMSARLVDDPGENHDLTLLRPRALLERPGALLYQMIPDALAVFERAVIHPHLAGLDCDAAVG